MYSENIVKVLKNAGIEFGDRVIVEKRGDIWEGVVLPRGQGNPDYLVLKLKSGYNVGIKIDKDTKVKLVEKVKKTKPAKRTLHKKKDLPNIGLIHTGGTIASKVDYSTGGVSASFTDEDLLSSVPEIFDEANIHSKLLFNVMSEDMNYKHWLKIAETVYEEIQDSYGVVVTHGTDTMAYTSAAISFMVQGLGKPVVFTGSQRSSDRPSSDAFLNLLNAVRAAKLDISGVYVNMHDTMSDESTALVRGTRVRKMHTSRRDAFKPVNDDYVVRILWDGRVEFLQDLPKRKESKPKLDAVFEPKTALIKVHPNMSPEILDFYIDKGYRGLVIEGTGLGHIPVSDENYSLLSSIQRAIDEDIFVGITSQCIFGRVHPYVYANLRKLSSIGAVFLEDMLSEVAYVKLGWALGHDWDLSEVKKVMLTSISSEVSKRSLP